MEGELTPQQRNLVKNLLKGLNLTQAAIKAGYSENNAAMLGNRALKRIQKKMPQILDRNGLTDNSLVKKYLKPALEASETKFFQKDGVVTETRDVISWDPRLRALDMTFKLKGSYAPTNVEHTGNIVHEITAIEQKMAQGSLEKIRALQSEAENPLIAEVVEDPQE
jgi:phage terminase small subunit